MHQRHLLRSSAFIRHPNLRASHLLGRPEQLHLVIASVFVEALGVTTGSSSLWEINSSPDVIRLHQRLLSCGCFLLTFPVHFPSANLASTIPEIAPRVILRESPAKDCRTSDPEWKTQNRIVRGAQMFYVDLTICPLSMAYFQSYIHTSLVQPINL